MNGMELPDSIGDTQAANQSRAAVVPQAGWNFDLSINYLLPHPVQNLSKASPYLGFTPGVLDIGWVFAQITQLPADALDLVASLDDKVGRRALGAGSYQVIPIQIDALPIWKVTPERPLACVFSSPEVTDEVSKWVVAQEAPVLHVAAEGDGTITPEQLTFDQLVRHVWRGLEWAHGKLDAEGQRVVSHLLSRKPIKPHARSLKLSARGHNVTAPNELTLSGLGHALGPHTPIDPRRPSEFEDAIVKSFDFVIADRARALHKPLPYVIRSTSVSAVVWAPSVYAHLRGNAPLWRAIAREVGRKPAQLLKRFVVSRPGFAVEIDMGREELEQLGEAIAPWISFRQRELDTVVGATAILCGSHCAGALRLSPGIEQLWGRIKDLARCARTASTHQTHKLMRLGPRLAADTRKVMGDRYLGRLARAQGHVKLLCDYPVEWADMEGLPLGLCCELSRIPTVPGNVFLQQALSRRHIRVSRQELRDVLVIRAYSKGDRIAPILERAVKVAAGGTRSRVQVRFVDVHSEEELIRALNEFTGALMIFDGHGVNLGPENVAALMIGSQPIDPWRLNGLARIPPLVWLSACDTHPIDGSHASSGAGFLVAGAHSVLATLLPLDAVYAATIVGRMIFRIDEFLEGVLGRGRPAIRWSTVVTGMLRMAYASDLIRFCCDVSGQVSQAIRMRIQLKANLWINGDTSDWFDRVVHEVSRETGLKAETVREASRVNIAWSDVARYVHLGNPECVLVTD